MAFGRTKTYTLDAARVAIQRYCAYQERCQSEVVERLRSMGVLPEAQADLVAELMADGYLSEERFARAYARGKFRIKGWGPRKIAQGLQAKRVSSACIALGLAELDEGELRAYLLRKKGDYPTEHEFLAWCHRKGYDRSLAASVLRIED
jgi:regulatory protein